MTKLCCRNVSVATIRDNKFNTIFSQSSGLISGFYLGFVLLTHVTAITSAVRIYPASYTFVITSCRCTCNPELTRTTCRGGERLQLHYWWRRFWLVVNDDSRYVWAFSHIVATLLIIPTAAQTSATLTCKCGSNYLPETALAHCNRTTASCQGATCALAATLTGGGFVQLEWFCFSGAPESAFVTESFCHGVNVAPRDRFAYLCCSNYSMCNAELNATFVSTVHPTSSYQCAYTDRWTII